jgi:Phage tail assembly chaperone proteins, E, or 41 or 14
MDDVTRKTPQETKAAGLGFRFKLSAPVMAHGEEVTELTFREPTGADIVNDGNPIRWDMTINEAVMEKHMSTLATVPPSTIKQLKAKDWQIIAFELGGRFFLPISKDQIL